MSNWDPGATYEARAEAQRARLATAHPFEIPQIKAHIREWERLARKVRKLKNG